MYLSDILILLLLVLANGVFAMSEAAVISSRKARLMERANRGDARARAALALSENPNDFLSTVQIGITLIGILAGAFGGARLSDDLAAWLARFPAIAPYSGAIALAIVVGGITYASLVIGELVPKRLALNNPEGVASAVSGPMRRLSAITMPAVRLLSFSTDFLVRILGGQKASGAPVSEEEVKILLQEGAEAGVFHASEHQMLQSVFRLTDRHVNELMVPRLQTVWLDINDPLETNLQKMEQSQHSRFPVGEGTLDNFLGMVSVKDVWAHMIEGTVLERPDFDLRELLWQPPLFPEAAGALHALETFRQTGRHTGVVLDEYGGVQGIVTLMDVLEAIVGDIPEMGEIDERAVRREDGSWLLDGMLLLDEVKDRLDIRALPGEEEGHFETLGGLVMAQLERLPHPGDTFDACGWRWEVVDLDGHRVDRVLVTHLEDLPPAG